MGGNFDSHVKGMDIVDSIVPYLKHRITVVVQVQTSHVALGVYVNQKQVRCTVEYSTCT